MLKGTQRNRLKVEKLPTISGTHQQFETFIFYTLNCYLFIRSQRKIQAISVIVKLFFKDIAT